MPLINGTIYEPTGQVTLPRRTLYYLDPERAYLCTRLVYLYTLNATWHDNRDWLKGVSNPPRTSHYRLWQVLQYGKTWSGMWYVKEQAYDSGNFNRNSEISINHTEDLVLTAPGIITVYLNEDPNFPKDIFDPNTYAN